MSATLENRLLDEQRLNQILREKIARMEDAAAHVAGTIDELSSDLAESKMWADACAALLNEDGTLLAQRYFESAKRRARKEAKP